MATTKGRPARARTKALANKRADSFPKKPLTDTEIRRAIGLSGGTTAADRKKAVAGVAAYKKRRAAAKKK